MKTEKHCSAHGCDRPFYGKGFCKAHWKRWKYKGDPMPSVPLVRYAPPKKTLEDKKQFFFDRVNKTSGCWLWVGAISGDCGYGELGKWHGRKMTAHRFSYLIHHGEIPAGLVVCHRCDNKLCVNPNHLFLGTYKDNSQDALSKGRLHFGERSPQAVLTESDVLLLRGPLLHVRNRDLAARYGVTSAAIYNAKHYKTWKHLAA